MRAAAEKASQPTGLANLAGLLSVLFVAGVAWAEVPADSPLRQAPRIVEASGELPGMTLLAKPKFSLFVGWTRQILSCRPLRVRPETSSRSAGPQGNSRM